MAEDRKPNIIIFNPDQWRGDVLGHMGNPAAVTPALDRMVEEDSVSFRNAFCQNPVCTPSRCSFMAGWYPHVRGHRTMYHMLRPDEPMLLRTLRQNGYFVWWGGKNDVVPGQNGFDDYCDIKFKGGKSESPNLNADPSWRGDSDGSKYYSFYYGRREKKEGNQFCVDGDMNNVFGAIDFIKSAHHTPFCVYLPLSFPHPPYIVEDPFFSMIDRSKLPDRTPTPREWKAKPSILKGIHQRQHITGWSEDRWKELRATYYGMCARQDELLGLLLQALRDAGVYDDTAVFVFSDHGDFTGDYGLVEKTQNTFEDCLSRVPFVIKPPKSIPIKPRVSDAMVELTDFSATVEAMTGITPAHTHFGKSLLPLIAGETDTHRDAVFCEGGRIHGETHCMEMESTSSQRPQGLYWPRVNLQQSEGPEHTKATMCRTKDYKYVRRLYESDELYDLRSDPTEQNNRIDDPALSQVLADLKERLLTFYQETCDVVPHDTDKR